MMALLEHNGFLTARVYVCIALLAGLTARGITIDYDASVPPDHSTLRTTFETQKDGGGGPSWTAQNGELTITTVSHAAIWFGNHPALGTVPWDVADSSDGNYASLRAKLAPNSTKWSFRFGDGSHIASLTSDNGSATYYRDTGSVSHSIDNSVYHTYSLFLVNGQVTYRIDGTPIYSGPAYPYAVSKLLYVGDTSGEPSGASGSGSLIVDHFFLQTHVSEEPLPAAAPALTEWAAAALVLALAATACWRLNRGAGVRQAA